MFDTVAGMSVPSLAGHAETATSYEDISHIETTASAYVTDTLPVQHGRDFTDYSDVLTTVNDVDQSVTSGLNMFDPDVRTNKPEPSTAAASTDADAVPPDVSYEEVSRLVSTTTPNTQQVLVNMQYIVIGCFVFLRCQQY